LLELARQWSEQPIAPPPILAFFDAEETGLLGSLAVANDPELRDRLDGAIILDMVGYTCTTPGCQTYPDLSALGPIADHLPTQGDFLAAISDRRQPALLESFTSTLATTDTALPPLLSIALPDDIPLPDLVRSDHAAFWNVGIGAVLLTDTANFRNPHYHQSSDRPPTLDRTFLAGSAQHLLYALYTMLNG
jgi:Zn-dependent M28 family amino/carboxypeptidase